MRPRMRHCATRIIKLISIGKCVRARSISAKSFWLAVLRIDGTFILYARHELNGCISTQITQYNDKHRMDFKRRHIVFISSLYPNHQLCGLALFFGSNFNYLYLITVAVFFFSLLLILLHRFRKRFILPED